MVRLCTAPEELPPVDGPARLFVEHPPAGEGPGRHERRIPLRPGNPSTVHYFDGTRPRAANDFEWDPHHSLASCEKCRARIIGRSRTGTQKDTRAVRGFRTRTRKAQSRLASKWRFLQPIVCTTRGA